MCTYSLKICICHRRVAIRCWWVQSSLERSPLLSVVWLLFWSALVLISKGNQFLTAFSSLILILWPSCRGRASLGRLREYCRTLPYTLSDSSNSAMRLPLRRVKSTICPE